MGEPTLDLLQAFQAASKALKKNRTVLNKADEYNHDHGDNMVEIFKVITQAMEEKKNASPADQLAYASELLRDRQSGSARNYSQGLAQAAGQVAGKGLNQESILPLIQLLLSGGQAPASQPEAQPDLLGSLLGGLTGSGPSSSKGGVDAADLLSAGMAFMQARQQGEGGLEALLGALVSGNQESGRSYRNQSKQIVADNLLKNLLPLISQ